MITIASTRAGPELFEQWRQQIGRQHRRRAARGTRPLVALSYLANGRIQDGLIDVRRLVLVVLHDQQSSDGPPAIRLAGFSAGMVPWGAAFGGADRSVFDKDLSLAPRPEARGRRLDLAKPELLLVALQLDRHLERHFRYPYLPRRLQPRLPQLWAGFSPSEASGLKGDGPELLARSRASGASLAELLAASQRRRAGLVLYPLEYVSHAWAQFRAIFADLTTIPKRQVLAIDRPAVELCGFSGAVEYDFTQTRFAARGLH